ncbi:hypothetical protein F5Y18DRAFT_439603 [Xylariaceae sp. FL1019]|nr:hypothetical protein F5Y18DRAFT_439603 [Xylariaceae sp. FL1019]
MTTQKPQPEILWIVLGSSAVILDEAGRFLSDMRSKARVTLVATIFEAHNWLSQKVPPTAILIDYCEIMRDENSIDELWTAILEYVRRGGTAVLLGSDDVRHYEGDASRSRVQFKVRFSGTRLPWEIGEIFPNDKTYYLNDAIVETYLAPKLRLFSRYPATNIRNVAREHVWYYSDHHSLQGRATVAMAPVYHGNIGYVGDKGIAYEQYLVIAAMCGLLPQPDNWEGELAALAGLSDKRGK